MGICKFKIELLLQNMLKFAFFFFFQYWIERLRQIGGRACLLKGLNKILSKKSRLLRALPMYCCSWIISTVYESTLSGEITMMMSKKVTRFNQKSRKEVREQAMEVEKCQSNQEQSHSHNLTFVSNEKSQILVSDSQCLLVVQLQTKILLYFARKGPYQVF